MGILKVIMEAILCLMPYLVAHLLAGLFLLAAVAEVRAVQQRLLEMVFLGVLVAALLITELLV
jgi:hypothetical protein